MSATSAPICSSQVSRPKSVYRRAVFGVVVAGADVHVVADAVALAAHDEDALGVRLQRRQAVDDVHARLLQRAAPGDVRPLVEARLDLDQAHGLLAALGGADQRRDERRVVARAVHGLLDREHVRVVDRLLDEALDRGHERVVRVVEQDVALAHRGQHVGLLVLVGLQPRLGDRRPRRVAQVASGPGCSTIVPQVLEVEQPVDLEDVLGLDLQRARDLLAHRGAHRRRRPRRARPRRSGARAAPPRPPAARSSASSETVKSASRVTRKTAWSRISMPGKSTSRFSAISSSSGTNVRPSPTGDEARQHLLRHLHAREGLDLGDRVAHDHAERQREVGDVRERPPEADRQRRQHGEDLAPEALVERSRARRRVDLVVADDPDAVLGQRGPQLAVQAAATGARCARARRRADRLDRLARRAPVLQRLLDAGVDLVVQAGDADHEELVEVGRDDRAELHAAPAAGRAGPRRARARASLNSSHDSSRLK